MPFSLPIPNYFLPVLAIWSVIWKGIALWHAAMRREKSWFILFLVLNTIGVAEILYLIFKVKLFASGTPAATPPKQRKS